jgi:hypothetical protein
MNFIEKYLKIPLTPSIGKRRKRGSKGKEAYLWQMRR